MRFFEKKCIDWYYEMENILENVDLSDIIWNNDSIIFKFSRNGKYYKKISCTHILKISVEYDYFMLENMPYFILDVRLKKLSDEDFVDSLKYFKYGFNTSNLKVTNQNYYFLNIVGSDISVDVLCNKIEIGQDG